MAPFPCSYIYIYIIYLGVRRRWEKNENRVQKLGFRGIFSKHLVLSGTRPTQAKQQQQKKKGVHVNAGAKVHGKGRTLQCFCYL